MKSIPITKTVTSLFLIGVLMLTVFMQNTVQRKRIILSAPYYQRLAASVQEQGLPDTKKQAPVSSTIIEEEEDKIIEDFENISTPHHSILVALSYTFPHQFFDEPLLTVVGLPPWS